MATKIKSFRFEGLDTPENTIDEKINGFIINNNVSEVVDLKVTVITKNQYYPSGTRKADLLYTLMYK